MENLSKEFFDSIGELYPQAVQHFFNWLKKYKQHIGWEDMFDTLDFCDLPYDMQNGILERYDIECNLGIEGYMKIRSDEPRRYTKLFIDVQDAIGSKKLKTK